MGGGKHKTHESFVVTPSQAAKAAPPPVTDVGDTAHEAPMTVLDEPVPAPEEIEDDTEVATSDPVPSTVPTDQPAGDTVLTPVPDELTVGDGAGSPLLVGGADLVDSTATLVAYDSTGGPREVLVAVVDEDAEAKLLESLALSGTKMIPVQVETDITGRLPVDEEHQLYERLAKVAKSTNHHLKAGDGMPAHTTTELAALQAELAGLAHTHTSSTDQAMIAHYQTAVDGLLERTNPGYAIPYDQGGKMPTVIPFETTGKATVTKHVPAPATDLAPGQLPTAARDATRISPTLTGDGTATWDGAARSHAKGKEYVADLGDGYTAVYRPYGANDPASSEYSLRGSLEVLAPQGAGHAPELVDRLGQLNLANRPMTATEGEWAYLRRNVWAQKLDHHPAVTDALAHADGLEDAVEHVLFAQRAHQAIGLSEPALHRFAQQLRLDAETKVLPEKVKILRDGVATATGHPSGAALAASTGYDPTPRRSRAGLAWERFDVHADTANIRAAFGQRGLTHRVTAGNLGDLFRSGVLASTERRALMGVKAGKGSSESADKLSGGASSIFLRVGKPSGGVSLYWDDPTTILSRADWYAYGSDHFGALNPKGQHSLTGETRNPLTVAGFSAGNEIMVRHGLDLLGTEAPSRVRCANPAQRQEVLDILAAKHITHLAGRPVSEVIQ